MLETKENRIEVQGRSPLVARRPKRIEERYREGTLSSRRPKRIVERYRTGHL